MYTIIIGSGWRNYARYVPSGITPVGVIRDSRTGACGALVHIERTEEYAMVNAGAWTQLNQAAVTSALEASMDSQVAA